MRGFVGAKQVIGWGFTPRHWILGSVVQGMGISVGQRWCVLSADWMGSQAALPHITRSRKVWMEDVLFLLIERHI